MAIHIATITYFLNAEVVTLRGAPIGLNTEIIIQPDEYYRIIKYFHVKKKAPLFPQSYAQVETLEGVYFKMYATV